MNPFRLLALTLGALVLIAGPRAVAADPPLGGLSDEDRKTLYHMPEGSELFPIEWLRAMVSSKTGRPFLDDLGRFGLIEDTDGPAVAEGDARKLPVGLTRTVPRGSFTEMIGVNCAACHVAEIRFKTTTVRVDGASSLFDIQGFYAEMFQSAAATFSRSESLLAFLTRLKENEARDPGSKLLVGLLPFLKGQAESDGEFEGLLLKRLRAILSGPAGTDHSAADILKAKSLWDRAAAMQQFLAASQTAVREEVKLLEGLPKFIAKLGIDGTSLPLLLARLEFLKRLRALDSHGGAAPRPGFGRVDAFTSARNFLFDRSESRSPAAPVRYPFLWGLGDRWLHWDGNTRSVMERNVGQALGLGGVVDSTSRSTLLPGNLHKLEQIVRKIKPPVWPEAFGPIPKDSQKYADGAALFKNHCSSCHERQEPGDDGPGRRGWKVPEGGVVFDVKTDPHRTMAFADKMADGKDFAKAVGDRQRDIKRKSFKEYRAELIAEYGVNFEANFDQPEDQIRWLTTGGYVARPLSGTWATAPYLHNGSVPTLADLLEPASRRPIVFPVGHREYDPARIGYVSKFEDVPQGQIASWFVFDTRIAGNSNSGHEFGTTLTADQKSALLLYLKSR